MKFAISNIAWTSAEDAAVVDLMRVHGFTGLEIAPTRVWADPFAQTDSALSEYRSAIAGQGFILTALQALLFGHPELTIFETAEKRAATLNHLKKSITLAAQLGAKVLVFGSPKNRVVGALARDKTSSIAVDFFAELGDFASKNGTVFCIEPNPPSYGADFICTVQDGIDLVRLVNTKGFRLHLDSGAMTINKEDYAQTIAAAIPYTGYFHISEPHLQLVSAGGTDHPAIARALQDSGYDGWVSIEMKSGLQSSNVAAVEAALAYVARTYGRVGGA